MPRSLAPIRLFGGTDRVAPDTTSVKYVGALFPDERSALQPFLRLRKKA
jgi:hypothetical protein